MRKFCGLNIYTHIQTWEGARVKHGNLRGVECLIDSTTEDTEIVDASKLDSNVFAIDDDICKSYN